MIIRSMLSIFTTSMIITPNEDTNSSQHDAGTKPKSPISSRASNEGSKNGTYPTKKWDSLNRNVASSTPYFKGNITELSAKVFVSGSHQSSKYDDSSNTLLSYFGITFDHRIHQAFEQKDKAVGLALLTKAIAPKKMMTTVQMDPNDSSATSPVGGQG